MFVCLFVVGKHSPEDELKGTSGSMCSLKTASTTASRTVRAYISMARGNTSYRHAIHQGKAKQTLQEHRMQHHQEQWCVTLRVDYSTIHIGPCRLATCLSQY